MSRPEIDLERPATLEAVARAKPDIVVNAAAWTDVDGCALDPDRAMLLNGAAAGAVATAAADAGAVVIQVSTNEVFDGEPEHTYDEHNTPDPINPYGLSKRAGEQAVASANVRHVIVRTAWLFSDGPRTFPARIRAAADRAVSADLPLRVVLDEIGNPTWVPDLADAIVRISVLARRDAAPTVVHVAGWPPTSRLEWARAAIADLLAHVSIEPIELRDYARPSRVPPHAVLDVTLARSLGIEPSDWRKATAELLGSRSHT